MVRAMLLIFPAKCQGSVFGNPVLVLKKKIIMVVEERKVIYFYLYSVTMHVAIIHF
jgi:hypothetical protein